MPIKQTLILIAIIIITLSLKILYDMFIMSPTATIRGACAAGLVYLMKESAKK